jgi:GSH-dependent disulfide-bond oxidoreductase
MPFVTVLANGQRPYLGGGFGRFYAYASMKIEYAIDRFAMEVKRQLEVLDRRLAASEYIVGSTYTIADMAIFPPVRRLGEGVAVWRCRVPERGRVQEHPALGGHPP